MAEAKLTITTNARQVSDDLKQVADNLSNINKAQTDLNESTKQSATGYEKTASAIRDTQKASQDLALSAKEIADWDKKARDNTMRLYTERQRVVKKALEDERGTIEKLREEIKKYTEAWEKAKTPEKIAETKRELERLKAELKEFEKFGVKANENVINSTDKLGEALTKNIKKFTLVGAAIGLVAKVGKDMVETFKDTVFGMELVTTASEIWKQVIYDLTTAHNGLGTSIANALAVAKQLNELRKEERAEIVENAKLTREYQELYFKSVDRTLSEEQRLKKINEALEKHNKLIDNEIHIVEKQLAANALALLNRKNSTKLLDEEAQLKAKLETLEGQRFSQTKRLESQRTMLEKELSDKRLRTIENELNARIKKQDDFQKLATKLQQDYDQSVIESLQGEDKLIAQKDYALRQLDAFRLQILALGDLTPEMEEKIQVLALNIRNKFAEALKEYAKLTPEQKDAISTALLGGMPTLAGIQKSIIETKDDETTSFWEKVFLDEEDKQSALDALRKGADEITGILGDIFDQQVEDLGRRRDLLDTQISEAQRSLELETELYQEGYANNVDAKRREVEELTKLRNKAIADEEEAIRKQKAFDSVLQTVNLITAASEIFKTLSKIPVVGIPLAIATIATMFGAFAAAKTQANSATKLAEGGSGSETGVITGKRHSQGGERFLDHVEVEKGEAWGVLSRPATQKYGEVFHEMVSSFNKDKMPSFVPISNSIMVENNGPNTRLDKVIKEQRRLNEAIMSQPQVSISGNKKIVKQGNRIRIIG